MKYSMAEIGSVMILFSTVSMAESPLPTFHKEAITEHPYQRTEQQENSIDTNAMDRSYMGNTGTASWSVFYVQRIIIDSNLPKPNTMNPQLQQILDSYRHRNVSVSEFPKLIADITAYYRAQGYTAPQVFISQQDIKNSILRIHVSMATYGTVILVKNESDVKNSILQRYIRNLKAGEIITDKPLERAIQNLNDLPAVTARAVLQPGTPSGTTKLGIEVMRQPVWNSYLFTDNSGGYYSGKYRYGLHTAINDPTHAGDTMTVSGTLTSHHVKDYSVNYEMPVGIDGTRWGVGWSQSSYELHTNSLYDSLGQSQGISWYGLTPLYSGKQKRVSFIYGYDHRDIQDSLRFHVTSEMDNETDKIGNVWHMGISGSWSKPHQDIQYDVTYWYGHIHTEDTMGDETPSDGIYHKATGDFLSVWYENQWNYRISASGQVSNRFLDGSEQFYLGGMDGVRAYGASDGYGDAGYLLSGEIRRQTGIKNLEAAAFMDTSGAKLRGSDSSWDHLSGWGLGLHYQKDNDWDIQLDYAWKIHARDDRTEPGNCNGRLWLQVYKMF